MSNQTFVKKDRISFAQNLNETIVIAPSNITTNALYIGPNSAISYDTGSNVVSINYLAGVTLSNQYIYADGTYLSNLPNGLTQSNLTSTIVGLGTFGYISSATGGGLTQNNLTSTIVGLGTFGYISSTQLYSTVAGLQSYVSSFIDPSELSSTIIGIVTPDFISSIGFTSSIVSSLTGLGTLGYISSASLQSTVVGLGTLGYISSASLQSTVVGLGNIYISTNIVPSTIVGLGSFGYISSLSLQSTVRGLGNVYLSTNIVPSTIVGLGSFGYLSTNIVPSTIVGLGTFGYLSTNTVPSTIVGLGSFGYISSTQLTSTVRGLGNVYLSTNIVPSTIVGLGTFGYLSTNTVPSTIVGLGSFGYLSTNIVPSTIVGLGSFGYISSTQLTSTVRGLGNIYLSSGGATQLSINSTIIGLGTFGYLSSFNSISSLNISTENLFANIINSSTINNLYGVSTTSLNTLLIFFSTAQGYQISTNRIVGETRTANLYPLTTGAIIGYGSLTGDLGFYNEGHFRSTFTQVIQPTLDNNAFSNVVRINGNVSSQNIFVSSIFGRIISTNTLATNNLVGVGVGGAVYSQNFYPIGVNILGFGGGSANGAWDSASIRNTQTSSIITNNISAGVINVAIGNFSSISGNGSQIVGLNAISSLSLQSTVRDLGNIYLSTNIVPSTIVGLGSFGYLSTNIVPSTIVGLGTFGYISSTQLQSTVTGLIDSPEVQSTIIGLGTFGYLSTNIVPSTILGLGSFGYISSSQLQSTVTGLIEHQELTSTIVGLGTFGYISSTQLLSTTRGLGSIYLSTNIVPSTIVGLGSFGYISSLSLQSTVTGLLDSPEVQSTIIGLGTFGYLSTNIIPSTVLGLGSFGYISSLSLQSTVRGLGNIYLSTNIVPSTIVGLGAFGYLSTNIVPSTIVGLGAFGYLSTNIVPSTIVGLGAFGYISSTQLTSTVTGLGNIYLSTNIVPSTIVGLGAFGYISSTQLTSTVRGLGNTYLSTNIVPSTIVGLGSFGYISSSQLQSTVVGLGASGGGGISQQTLNSTIVGWSGIPASTDVDINGSNITNVNQLYVDNIDSYIGSEIYFVKDINLDNYLIKNVQTIQTENITSVGGNITVNNSHLIPSVDDTYNLGSATNRWRELYVAGTSIHLGNSLVLSEDANGFLSTSAISVSSINVENLSTSVLTSKIITLRGSTEYGISLSENANGYLSINNGIIASDIHTTNISSSILTSQLVTLKGPGLMEYGGVIGLSFDIDDTSVGGIYVFNGSSDINILATNIKIGGTLDLSGDEITNVSQTVTSNSAATNYIIAQGQDNDLTGTASWSNSDFTQILTAPIINQFTYPNGIFSNFKVTFNLSGTLADITDTAYGFYVTFSNVTQPLLTPIPGLCYNANSYNYVTSNIFTPSNFTFNYTDMYSFKDYMNGDSFIPLLYIKGNVLSNNNTFVNGNFNFVIEPVVTYIPK